MTTITISQTVIKPIITVTQSNNTVVLQPTVNVTSGMIGGGDMFKSVYDPTGVESDAFKLSNMKGIIDGGNATDL